MALKSAFRAVLQVANSAGELQYWPPGTGGMWDAYTGGKLTMKETKYTPWDEQQRVYAGIKEVENYTIDQDYMIDVHGPLVKAWEVEGDFAAGAAWSRSSSATQTETGSTTGRRRKAKCSRSRSPRATRTTHRPSTRSA
jgi:hypothetical protein